MSISSFENSEVKASYIGCTGSGLQSKYENYEVYFQVKSKSVSKQVVSKYTDYF